MAHGDSVNVDVSIIVASHRRDYIEACVRSIVADADTKTEAIVVTDYPCGDLQRTFPDVVWLQDSRKSIPAKRNRGIKRARGKYCVFTDDDCVVEQGWVAAARECGERNPHAAGAEGVTRIDRPAVDAGGSYGQFKRLERGGGCRTNNIMYRRSVLTAVGGFDERFTVQREDLDLAFTIRKRGYAIRRCEEMRVVHRHRPGERWDLLKNCWNRRFDPLLFVKHPLRYLRYVRSPVPASIGMSGIAHAAGIAAAADRAWRVCFAVFGADLFGCGVFALKRLGFRRGALRHLPAQWVSYLCAPVVIVAALLWGTVCVFRRSNKG